MDSSAIVCFPSKRHKELAWHYIFLWIVCDIRTHTHTLRTYTSANSRKKMMRPPTSLSSVLLYILINCLHWFAVVYTTYRSDANSQLAILLPNPSPRLRIFLRDRLEQRIATLVPSSYRRSKKIPLLDFVIHKYKYILAYISVVLMVNLHK